jgi:hypothetical protein
MSKNRDSKGRFLPGNDISKEQRPDRIYVRDIRKAIQGAITPDDIANVMKRLLQSAMNGQIKAIKLLLEYTAGKPTHTVDLKTENGSVVFNFCTKEQKDDDTDRDRATSSSD